MAKKSQALISAELKIAALEARLVVAKDVYRSNKARIAELEAQLNARGATKVVAAQPKAQQVESVVTRFVRRDGVTCERVRTGNRAVIRELRTEVPGMEVSYP